METIFISHKEKVNDTLITYPLGTTLTEDSIKSVIKHLESNPEVYIIEKTIGKRNTIKLEIVL